MASDDVPRDLAEVHERFTPLLIAAAGDLAEEGLNVSPADALELVHDFYVVALERALTGYRPYLSKFSTYLYWAFRIFARRRIAREARLKDVLVPLEEGMEQPAAESSLPDAEEDPAEVIDRRLTWALARLPQQCRSVLEARVVHRENERDIAERLGWTRHEVRQRLAEAFGRVAVLMDHGETIREDLRPFALRLWRDEIPLMRVAKEMGLTRRAAQKRYRKLVRSLVAAARALEDVPTAREMRRKEA